MSLVDSVIDAVLEYLSRRETQDAVDRKLARPLLERARAYVAAELGWVVGALRALGAVMIVQLLLLAWLAFAVWALQRGAGR